MYLYKFKIIGVCALVIALIGILGSCDMGSDNDVPADTPNDQITLNINIEGEGETTPSEGEHETDKDAVVDISNNPDDGWKFLGWTGDITSAKGETSVIMEESKEITAHFIEKDEEGLVFEHRLTLVEDASKSPKMQVIIKNINGDKLGLNVIGTIYGNIADKADTDEKLFEFIDYDTFQAKTMDGEELEFSQSNNQINRDNHIWDEFFNIDEVNIDTGPQNAIKIEYETASNYDLWEGFGGNLSDFEGFSDPAHFWAVFKEWLLLRPQNQEDGIIARNHLHIDLPNDWDYAATYPEADKGRLDLGELEFMRWTNDKEWKNYQRSPLVLFHEDSYSLNSRTVKGTEIKDVYHKSHENKRNQEANHQIFRFLSEFIGELPMERVLYFSTLEVEGGGSSLEHGDAYSRAPYGYGYSSKGRFLGGGADIGPGGKNLGEPQKWSIEHWPDDDYNHLFPIHGTVRLWLGSIIRGHGLSEGLAAYAGSQAVASYYTGWNVEKHRYERKYEFYLEEVVQEDGSEEDVAGVTGHRFLNYFKRGLAFFYLDELISDKSGDSRSLKDANQHYYEEVLRGRDTLDHQKAVNLWLESAKIAADNYVNEDYIEEIVKHNIYGDRYGQKFLDLSDYLDVNLENYSNVPAKQ